MKEEEAIAKLEAAGLKYTPIAKKGFGKVYIGDRSYHVWPKSEKWQSTTISQGGGCYGIDRFIELARVKRDEQAVKDSVNQCGF